MIYTHPNRLEVEPLAILSDHSILCQLTNDRTQRCKRQFHELRASGGLTELLGTICQRYEWGMFFIEGEHEPVGGTRARTNHVTEAAGATAGFGHEARIETAWGTV